MKKFYNRYETVSCYPYSLKERILDIEQELINEASVNYETVSLKLNSVTKIYNNTFLIAFEVYYE